jgi:hypothetical protein
MGCSFLFLPLLIPFFPFFFLSPPLVLAAPNGTGPPPSENISRFSADNLQIISRFFVVFSRPSVVFSAMKKRLKTGFQPIFRV